MSRQPFVVQVLYNGELISRQFETVPYLDHHLFSYREFFPALSRNVANHLEHMQLTWTCSRTGETKALETPEDFSTATASLALNGKVTINISEVGMTSAEFQEGVTIPMESLNKLIRMVNSLEVSLKEKARPSNYPSFNFGGLTIQNKALVEFLSTISSESQLNQLINYAKKYSQLLKSFNDDEASLDLQLDRLLRTRHINVKDAVINSKPVTTDTKSNKNEEDNVISTNVPHDFTITVTEKYTNFCFELKNNTNKYFPEGMEMLTNFHSGKDIRKISVPHGIGPHNSRAFLRFKKEFGPYCSQLSDFTNFQIRSLNGNTLLYDGVRYLCDSTAVVFEMERVQRSGNAESAAILSEANLKKLEGHSTGATDQNSFLNIVSAEDIEDIISITLSDVTSKDTANDNGNHQYSPEIENRRKKYHLLGNEVEEDNIPYLTE